MRRFLSAVALTLALAFTLSANDWPQFLGPNRDNTSPEKVAAWKGELKPLWKQPVGDAHSSPVVAGGVVFVFHQPKGINADALAAFDAATGKPLWEKSYEREKFDPPFGAGPRGTPAVAGGKVFTLGGTGILACWDAKTGDIAWKVDTLAEFKAPNLTFGISASPLVAGGKVFVNVGGKGAGMVAFDAASGKTAWKMSDDPASYSSPIAIDADGIKQVVFLTANGLVGVNPDTGKEYWRRPFKDLLQESATTPLFTGDALIGSSVTLGSVAVKISGKDAPAAPVPTMLTELWKSPQLNCYFSTPVLVGKDRLFMLNGKLSINPTITLRCVDPASGKVKWSKPDVGKYHAALIRTGDDKLLMLDDGGYLTLFEADAKEYKQLARSKVCGATWAHPALADGKVYLRDEKELICISLGG
jgi:outer membrane protein assembly factor BamB